MGSLGVQRGQGGTKYGVRTGCGCSQLSHRHLFYSQASVPVKAQGVEDFLFYHYYLEKMPSYLLFSMWI